ncbi:MAG: TetR/AcrR family transcriptional regulator [Clostridia bacterium]|nr:TetR/AcrR family transcriptional regulator [Clostridia bacterium]
MQYKKKEINEKILAAGRKEYFEKGYRGGNISAIAENAGVPVGNLYRYYDGKMGLLTAIVKPAYTQIPKMIDELFSTCDRDANNSARLLTGKLSEMFEKYGEDILILVDKCASTRYEDFFEKLIDRCDSLLLKNFFEQPTESDLLFCHTVVRSFITSVFDVLRKRMSKEETETLLERLLLFYFADIENRIRGGENEQ